MSGRILLQSNGFLSSGDEGGLAWNDQGINVQWPQVRGDYQGTASADGYCMEDGTRLNLSFRLILMFWPDLLEW